MSSNRLSNSSFHKSISDGELLDKNMESCVSSAVMSDPPTTKLKRTFTLPRNPFTSGRLSKRRIKNKENQQQDNISQNQDEQNNTTSGGTKKKLFRKPSIRKFFSKMVQQVSNVPNKNNINNGVNRPRDLSLSSNELRVPPLKPIVFPDGKVPGVIGLRNHGNTCFINAVLQCLSHTDILAEYFVLDAYKADLTRRNKLNSRKFGTRGELTEQLAVILKSIWSSQYAPEISTQFKEVVEKHGSQYRGANQHDAQEFLLWLLDKVHEDLNTATKKKYKAIKNSFGRPDDVVAEETLANHKRCNNSFVHALFQAQFRSSLTCPKCHSQSNTFDPFLCISIPVPQKQSRPLYVNVLYLSQQPREVRLGLSLALNADIRELREQLASDTGISEQHMLLTEIDDLCFTRTFADSQSSCGLQDTVPLYCIELPQLKDISEESYILLCWINVLQVEEHCSRFGSPYTMQVGRETSYEDLQKLILKEMSCILHDDILTNSQESSLFRMRVAEAGLPADTYLDPNLDHPLYMEAVDQALALCLEDSGPQHLKLVLEWDTQAKETTIADDTEPIEELASVKQLRNANEDAGAASLQECFELYTKEEVLGLDNAWHCPYCNRKQEVVKKLGLWSLPDILVIHLKRFRQSSKQRSTAKLTTLVDFPLYGFDMSAHLARRVRTNTENNNSMPGGLGWSPWKRPRRQTNRHDDNVYDLYAVCNHHGQDLQGGHYTAYCRNPYDGNWYAFDDTRVENIEEKALITQSAYILFYQHRSLSGSGSSSSSSSSSEHWIYKMPTFEYATQSDDKIDDDTKTKGAASADEAPAANFKRCSRGYATIGPASTVSTPVAPLSADKDHYSDDEAPLASKRAWNSPEVGRRASSVPREARVASPELSSSPSPSVTVTESSV